MRALIVRMWRAGRRVDQGPRPIGFLFVLNVAIFGLVGVQLLRFNKPMYSPPNPSIARWSEIVHRGELKIGDAAPEFCLATLDGPAACGLSELRTERPLVLVFGSYSCPTFRRRIQSLNQAYWTYREQAAFCLVYSREAHPEQDGRIPENSHLAPIFAPENFQEQMHVARRCGSALEIPFPILLDDLDGTTANRYRARPERVFLIDTLGRILFVGNGGDRDVAELTAVLEALPGQAAD